MIAHMNGNRRIRIVSKTNDVHGHNIYVSDAETGDAIINIKQISLTLSPKGTNKAEVTYYLAHSDYGLICDENRNPIEQTVVVLNPEIDVYTDLYGKENKQ